MARSRRKRAPGRSSWSRFPFLSIAIVLAVVGVVVYGCVAINHQISGYFGRGGSGHAAQTRESPAAEATASPEAAGGVSPSPAAAPTSSPLARLAIIIEDCGYSE